MEGQGHKESVVSRSVGESTDTGLLQRVNFVKPMNRSLAKTNLVLVKLVCKFYKDGDIVYFRSKNNEQSGKKSYFVSGRP